MPTEDELMREEQQIQQQQKQLDQKIQAFENQRAQKLHEISLQMEQIETYLGKMERALKESREMNKIDFTGDIEFHLKRLKEVIDSVKEQENDLKSQKEDIEGKLEDINWEREQQQKRFSTCSQTLDNLADRLESRGLLKEAEALDIVSNSIDAGFFFPGGKKDREVLEKMISEEVKNNPALQYANKVDHYKVDDTGNIISISVARFRTKTPPMNAKNAFVKANDGYWYLQDHEMEVYERPDGSMYLKKRGADQGDVKGLEVAEWGNK